MQPLVWYFAGRIGTTAGKSLSVTLVSREGLIADGIWYF
jgi:hypothetical protein